MLVWMVLSSLHGWLIGDLAAAEMPKSPEALREAASHIVTGEVTKLESRVRLSGIESGGLDDGIECTVALHSVEKGDGIKTGDHVIANCFRPRARLAFGQWLSLQGHSPLPARGQVIRVHLLSNGERYHVLHPNGFSPPPGTDQFIEANEIALLGRRPLIFTLLLPLELWVLIAVGALLMAHFARITDKPRRRTTIKFTLALASALWTAGLLCGFLNFQSVIMDDPSRIRQVAVIFPGALLILTFAALTRRRFISVYRSNAAGRNPSVSSAGSP